MGARLRSQFVMTVEDPSGGDDNWTFQVTTPSVTVIAELEELLKGSVERQTAMMALLVSDPEMLAKLQGADGESGEEVQAELMARYGSQFLEQTQADEPMGIKIQTAELIAPYCKEPVGLTDADGAACTWAALKEQDEPYAVSVLHDAAAAVYDRVRGAKGAQVQKNLVSSSQS